MALRLRYQTIEFGKTDIHLCMLRGKQEFHDTDGEAEDLGISSSQWSLFGVVWPSSIVLANHMSDYDTQGKRILEVGCGMALSSLLLNHQGHDVTACDYHPEAGNFLARNTKLNHDKPIPYERADWAKESETLGLFDVIIGSDLLYEDQHIALLADFIARHAKPNCEVILVDPGRGRKNKLGIKMGGHGFTHDYTQPDHTDYLTEEFHGFVLTFARVS